MSRPKRTPRCGLLLVPLSEKQTLETKLLVHQSYSRPSLKTGS